MEPESEEECTKMVRITPSVYERMRVAAARDSRSIAKEVDFACREYLRKNHPSLLSMEIPEPPKEA